MLNTSVDNLGGTMAQLVGQSIKVYKDQVVFYPISPNCFSHADVSLDKTLNPGLLASQMGSLSKRISAGGFMKFQLKWLLLHVCIHDIVYMLCVWTNVYACTVPQGIIIKMYRFFLHACYTIPFIPLTCPICTVRMHINTNHTNKCTHTCCFDDEMWACAKKMNKPYRHEKRRDKIVNKPLIIFSWYFALVAYVVECPDYTCNAFYTFTIIYLARAWKLLV